MIYHATLYRTTHKGRQFFIKVKKYKVFHPSLKAVRYNDNKTILIEPHKKATRWREYIEDLLNSELPESLIPQWNGDTA